MKMLWKSFNDFKYSFQPCQFCASGKIVIIVSFEIGKDFGTFWWFTCLWNSSIGLLFVWDIFHLNCSYPKGTRLVTMFKFIGNKNAKKIKFTLLIFKQSKFKSQTSFKALTNVSFTCKHKITKIFLK